MSICILGCGGLSKQILEVFHLEGRETRLYDDLSEDKRVVGKIADIPPLGALFCAIGSCKVRESLYLRFSSWEWINCIHPRSYLSIDAYIGRGNYLGPNTSIMPGAKIGNNNIIDPNVILSHDSTIGDSCHLAGGCVLLGYVKVGNRVLIGANASILPGKKIGNRAIVGAGAVVTCDVLDDEVVVGIPARPMKIPQISGEILE